MKFVPLIFQVCERCGNNRSMSISQSCDIQTLKLEARPQQEASAAAKARGEVFVGVSPEIKNRSVYNDFLVAQVKVSWIYRVVFRANMLNV